MIVFGGNKKIRHVRNEFENALIIQNSIQQYVLIIYSVVEFDLIQNRSPLIYSNASPVFPNTDTLVILPFIIIRELER